MSIAVTVTLAIHACFPPVWGEDAPLRERAASAVIGTLLAPGGERPLVGARVMLAGPDDELFTAAATDGDGSFRLEGLPAADYRLAVATESRLYLVQTPLHLQSGEMQRLHVVLLDDGEVDVAAEPTGVAGIWQRPFLASLMVVGAAIVVGVLVQEITKESDAAAASPF